MSVRSSGIRSRTMPGWVSAAVVSSSTASVRHTGSALSGSGAPGTGVVVAICHRTAVGSAAVPQASTSDAEATSRAGITPSVTSPPANFTGFGGVTGTVSRTYSRPSMDPAGSSTSPPGCCGAVAPNTVR